ncbi:MAG TPA: hypothetical protein VK534_00670 [Methylomirabilota bacterium]|nr:hypothetical protein [Methylomirabilota bacterium]
MDKRHLHHLWTKLKWLKPWYFLVIAVVFGAIAVYALRANNQQMIKLRQAVYSADKANTDVQTPLKALQSYVTTHMNTDLSAGHTGVYPPIQLKYTYDRLTATQQAQEASASSANSQIYNDAQKACEAQNSHDVSGRNRVPCIQQYVQSHTAASTDLPKVPEALYKFSFVSPTWSPDLAGWSIVIASLSGLVFIVTFIAQLVLRKTSK